MLISTNTIADSYSKGLEYAAEISYSRFIKELYGMRYRKNDNGIKLLLLLHALDSWDNRRGATNHLCQLQILRIMDNISKLRQTNPTGSAYAAGLQTGTAGGGAALAIRDTNTVDLSLSNNQLEATIKRSAAAGNLLQEKEDGLYLSSAGSGGGSSVRVFSITGDQFASATRYDDASLKDMDVQVWHRGLGFLTYYKADPDNADNEFELLDDGGFNILIPGFNAKQGTNYFTLFVSNP